MQFDLPAGAYEVVVTAQNGRSVSRPLKIDPGASADWTVVLPGEPSAGSENSGMIQLSSKVFFPLRKSEMTVEAFQTLDELVKILNEHPEILKVRISGHADSGPEKSKAEELSDQRGAVIYDYLVNAGIEPGRLVVRGYGDSVPLQEGSTEAIHSTNRRVEFRILEFGEE